MGQKTRVKLNGEVTRSMTLQKQVLSNHFRDHKKGLNLHYEYMVHAWLFTALQIVIGKRFVGGGSL